MIFAYKLHHILFIYVKVPISLTLDYDNFGEKYRFLSNKPQARLKARKGMSSKVQPTPILWG